MCVSVCDLVYAIFSFVGKTEKLDSRKLYGDQFSVKTNRRKQATDTFKEMMMMMIRLISRFVGWNGDKNTARRDRT